MLKPWQLDLAIIVVTVVFGFGIGFGTRDYIASRAALKAAKTEVTRANNVVKVEQKSDRATQAVATDVAAKTVEIQTRTVEIVKEVPVYVTVEADRRCDITDGFVRLHDAAATGHDPIPYSAGQSPDASGGVEASAVAATVAQNYGQCLVWKTQVEGWQRWYAEQRSLWPTDGR